MKTDSRRQDDLYRIYLMPGAREDLRELRAYITRRKSRRTAVNYLRRLRTFYESLALAPYRGEEHLEHLPGMRVLGFERRVTIVFAIWKDEKVVEIVGFYYGGKSV